MNDFLLMSRYGSGLQFKRSIRAWLVVLFVGISGSGCTTIQAVTPQEITVSDGVKCPSVYRIEVVGRRGRLESIATGFSMGDGIHIVTNAHAIRLDKKLKISDRSGGQWFTDTTHHIDTNKDIAIVHLGEEKPLLPRFELAFTAPAAGQNIKVQAFAPQVGFVSLQGTVIDPPGNSLFGNYFRVTIPLIEGMSGAPVLDNQCRLLGIASFGIESHEHHYFAAPVSAISLDH